MRSQEAHRVHPNRPEMSPLQSRVCRVPFGRTKTVRPREPIEVARKSVPAELAGRPKSASTPCGPHPDRVGVGTSSTVPPVDPVGRVSTTRVARSASFPLRSSAREGVGAIEGCRVAVVKVPLEPQADPGSRSVSCHQDVSQIKQVEQPGHGWRHLLEQNLATLDRGRQLVAE